MSYSIGSGQTLSNVTLAAGDSLAIYNGGTVSNITVASGGTETVFSGGVASGGVVSSGGQVFISSGGAAYGDVVLSGGAELVSTGGTDVAPTVSSGGYVVVLPGAAISGTVSDGGEVVSTGVVTYIAGSGYRVSATALSGQVLIASGYNYVLPGGIAAGTVISSGGTQFVDSGGSASGTQVNSGGEETISSGGTTTGTTVNSGGAQVVVGGTTYGTVLSGNGSATSFLGYNAQQYVGAGVASGTIVDSGSDLIIDDVEGAAYGTVVNSGGEAEVYNLNALVGAAGGSGTVTLADTTVNNGGDESIGYDGEEIGGAVNSGGILEVFESGTVINETVKSGGVLNVEGSGVTSGVVINAGAVETLQSGAAARNTNVLSGGYLLLAPGVVANSTIGAGQVLSTGELVFNNGSAPVVDPAGPITLISGGYEFVLSNGLASGSVLNSGAAQDIYGGAASATVVSGGANVMVTNGTIYNATILNGGEVFLSGGTAYDTTIAGGEMLVDYNDGSGPMVSGSVDFDGAGTLYIAGAPMIAATISGFGAGDTLELQEVYGSAVLSGGMLEIINAASTVASFAVADVAGSNFDVSYNGDGQTFISLAPVCYLAGTRLATTRGDVAVEALRIGDEVPTLHAGGQRVKWIGRRAYAAPFCNHRDVLPICIKAGALEEGVPARDLFVSPGHALYLDGALVHAKRLVNGVSVVQSRPMDVVEYFHIELETHEIVFAENCPAETFVDESFRSRFQNAAEFHALYPGEAAEPKPCLPRLENGFALLALQQRIAARAGVFPPAVLGRLRGYVDQMDGTKISGWAQHVLAPELPVTLDVFSGGVRLGRVLADLYRADVYEEGFGSGYHGFEFLLPAGVTWGVEVRRACDGAVLATASGAAAA